MKRKGTKKRGVFARLRERAKQRYRANASPWGVAVWTPIDRLPKQMTWPEADPQMAPYNHRKRLFKFKLGWRMRLIWALQPKRKPIDTGGLKRSWGIASAHADGDRVSYEFE
jgi:hypothetical protein